MYTGLTVQWVLSPESLREGESAEEAAARRAAADAAGPQLPKVSVTSKPDELRRAFEAVQQQKTAQEQQRAAGQEVSSNGSTAAAPPPTPAPGPLPESPFFKGGGGAL